MDKNSFSTLSEITVQGKTYKYHSLPALEKKTGMKMARLPYSMKILIENLLRQEDGDIVKESDIQAVLKKDPKVDSDHEIQFMPARVLLQDFTGVPVVADMAAMRAAVLKKGGDTDKVNPLQPVDLVIDHSVQVDFYGDSSAVAKNNELDYERNGERYQFLKWGQHALKNFQVVPPSTGICHQVNLEYLSYGAMTGTRDGAEWIYPDTLVGTDSHTTMINGLGVLGWGVGGIEAEAAMLGQPCSMLIPQVVGFELKGKMPAGATATDLVLTVTQMLRKKGVVGKFVEFFGDGVASLSVADRATVANMAPEYGATCGIFPVDHKTIEYLRMSGRTERAERAEAYYKAQELWLNEKHVPEFSDLLVLDLATVEGSMAGPSKPHDRSALKNVRDSFQRFVPTIPNYKQDAAVPVSDPKGVTYSLTHGHVVIAAITSCTNTSNPDLMIGAGLLARNAARKGLKTKPWVKTSFAPGSKAVTEYMVDSGLMPELDKLKFNLVGYGCTTCIGNAGPLPDHIQAAIDKGALGVGAVLSGNRNFEARIHPAVRANYLASPPLVVAYALAGTLNIDLTTEPIGEGTDGRPVYLKDIWPDTNEIHELVNKFVTAKTFQKVYKDVFSGDAAWKNTQASTGAAYKFDPNSTYIKKPPFLEDIDNSPLKSIRGARALGVFGDFITTDHISPAGSIGKTTPAAQYLIQKGVAQKDFNSYGARRGNHEIMIRGTFANVRIRNKMVDKEGGITKHYPSGQEMTIFDASEKYAKEKITLVVVAGKEYGSGSSRDWAAKGTRLLGVRAVLAESFERIHRSNLVGMGVLPVQFVGGQNAESLGIKGDETFDIQGLDRMAPKEALTVVATRPDGTQFDFKVASRIDTANELRYFHSGGILPFVLNRM